LAVCNAENYVPPDTYRLAPLTRSDNYYETMDGLLWGVNPTYAHEWNGAGESEIKLQISRRETPTLEPERKTQCQQSYFELLPFAPAEINCLALPEILAKKIRACYQRNKARDIMIWEYTQRGRWISRSSAAWLS
jgi:Nucleotidyl transferase AbiEii toxin, Type IV TA system